MSHMSGGDFYASEKSALIEPAGTRADRTGARDGKVTVLKERVKVQAGEIIDAHVHEQSARCASSTREQIADAKAKGVLFSLHLKATMMKVSDPIMFGHAVQRVLQGCSSPSMRRAVR